MTRRPSKYGRPVVSPNLPRSILNEAPYKIIVRGSLWINRIITCSRGSPFSLICRSIDLNVLPCALTRPECTAIHCFGYRSIIRGYLEDSRRAVLRKICRSLSTFWGSPMSFKASSSRMVRPPFFRTSPNRWTLASPPRDLRPAARGLAAHSIPDCQVGDFFDFALLLARSQYGLLHFGQTRGSNSPLGTH